MRLPRRPGALLGALSVVILSSCVGSEVTSPDVDVDPSFAISDGSTGGSSDFYFLTPLADKNPNAQGDFNPFLLPTMQVCVIEADGPDGDTSCVDGTGDPRDLVVAPGALEVTVDELNEQYAFSWDTDGPETGAYDSSQFLLLEILVRGEVMGWIQLDPQDPNGPGQSTADAYAFRQGETIPVKFWLSTGTLCEPVGTSGVEECQTFSVDQSGGSLILPGGTNLGDPLQLDIQPESLEGGPDEVITLTLERIDPTLLGGECIPGPMGGSFDAPQFGDCFRVTTDGGLLPENPATVSVCIDLGALPESVDPGQLNMVRYNDDDPASPIWQVLPGVDGACGSEQALLDVPEDGLFRYAALGINAIASFVGPQPVAAGDLRLGGLTSSFSTFSQVMIGQMTAPDSVVLQPNDSIVEVAVGVTGFDSLPVPGATVHFDAPVGSLSATSATTDALGTARVTWKVLDQTPPPAPGTYTLTASAFGLSAQPIPVHGSSEGDGLISEDSVEVVVTLVGPPAQLTPSDTVFDSLTAGVGQELSITVLDKNNNAVVGAEVTWYCTSEKCSFSETAQDDVKSLMSTTNENGVATITWIPKSAGLAEVSYATVLDGSPKSCTLGVNCATFTARVYPAEPTQLIASPNDLQTALVGSTIPVSIVLQDEFDNVVPGVTGVTWSVTSGGGMISGATETGSDGSAAATWTLGPLPSLDVNYNNSAAVTAGGLSATFTARAICHDGWGTATADRTFGSDEWACAESREFTANISGGKTQAFIHWMNDAENLYLAVRVRQSASSKVNDVRFDFDNNGDHMAEVGDDAIGLTSGLFIDQFLSQKCFDRSQAGCGESDVAAGGSVDGAGALHNDGTYTTFELVHPLSSGDPKDFSRSDTTGENGLGFFLSLQQGNGAQGNTQWPGFRDYEIITIVGPPSSE